MKTADLSKLIPEQSYVMFAGGIYRVAGVTNRFGAMFVDIYDEPPSQHIDSIKNDDEIRLIPYAQQLPSKQRIIDLCKKLELYIQEDTHYQACISTGHIANRFDRFIGSMSSELSADADVRNEPKCTTCNWFKIGYGRCQWCIHHTESSKEDKSCVDKWESVKPDSVPEDEKKEINRLLNVAYNEGYNQTKSREFDTWTKYAVNQIVSLFKSLPSKEEQAMYTEDFVIWMFRNCITQHDERNYKFYVIDSMQYYSTVSELYQYWLNNIAKKGGKE